MPQLVAVNPDPTPPTVGTISDAEAAAMLRAAVRLFGHWNITDSEAAALLDVSKRSYARWKTGQSGPLSRDQKARLSNLLGIHKALRILFTEPERSYRWIRAANAVFGGRSALEIMLGGELTDLMRVRRLLDAERGAW